MAGVRLEHVAAGCNRVTHALDWGEGRLLAYAAHNAVLVYHPEEARVLGALLGHTDCVTCVRWLPAASYSSGGSEQPQPGAAATAVLASGSGDCSVRIWVWTPHSPQQPWRLAATLAGHTAPVTSLTSFPLGGGHSLLVSTAGDSEVLVWECDAAGSSSSGGGGDGLGAAVQQSAWRLRQRIAVAHQLQHCSALAALPADPGWLLLALGGVDGTVRLYCCPSDSGTSSSSSSTQFELVCQLAGHQDWIKSLAFTQAEGSKLLLASASQDKNVRVWSVSLQQGGQAGGSSEASSTAGAPTSDLSSALAHSLTRYAPKPLIRTDRHAYAATLEALLVGHEDWVHSVAWQPAACGSNGGSGGSASSAQLPCLLSASMDRTMMLWRPDRATGLWLSEESVGDAGANHLGYYTGVFAPDGRGIAAHGFTGALHIWRREGPDGDWVPQHALGGHCGPVVDACWAADGACLLTVSTDQTARMTTRLLGGHWCEIARPQVHGHDFSGVAALPSSSGSSSGTGTSGSGSGSLAANGIANGGSSGSQQGAAPPARHLYASGSEEKVVRVFEAPRAFRHTLAMARGQAAAAADAAAAAAVPRSSGGGGAAALGALLPALGLSNKAVYDEGGEAGGLGAAADGGFGGEGGLPAGLGAGAYLDGPDMAPHAAPSAVAGPPLEEHLAQNTLWPEIHKLYGHGNDLYCLAADPLGAYLASACRAQSADTAAIWLWDTQKWTGVAQLPAHTLTVTQLAFSPDGRFLASASRDRTVAVFERQQQQQQQQQQADAAPFRIVGRIKAHARIVWGLHWSPDCRLLATASRDGKVKVWSLGTSDGCVQLPLAPCATIACGDSVRSVQFAPACQPGASYHLAAGLESGAVQLLRLQAADAAQEGRQQQQQQQQGALAISRHELAWESSEFERHAAAVRRLCWRADEQQSEGPLPHLYQLASASDDHSLRIFSVPL